VHTLPETLIFFAFWVKLTGCRLVLDARDLTVELLESRWKVAGIGIVKTVSIVLEKMITYICDDIITASNGFSRSLIERRVPSDKITTIFNTADTSIFKFDETKKHPIKDNLRLLYHGTVSERFGVLVAVEAVVGLKEVFPDVELIIHGAYDPDYKNNIIKVVNNYGLQKNIILNGLVPLEQISEIVKTVHIGVVPYLSDSFMNKALSTKTFEYIAAGLPVVASRLNSSLELFNDSCIHYSEPGNSKSICHKIVELAKNPDLQEQKRINAFKQFKDYSDIVMGEKFYNLLNR
jgi:glycosyltransferase involved in cell wall biosynthesis